MIILAVSIVALVCAAANIFVVTNALHETHEAYYETYRENERGTMHAAGILDG